MSKFSMGKFEPILTLKEILDRFPQINIKSVREFYPVYYPIAIIEIKAKQKSFERFNIIELYVLKMLALGVKETDKLSELLGLPETYIVSLVRMLFGSNLITEEGSPTDTGTESVAAGRKVILSSVSQKYQMDGLNGYLLKFDNLISEEKMFATGDMDNFLGILKSKNEVSSESIIDTINKDKDSFFKKEKSVFNVNIEKIEDIKFIEMNYTKGYLLKLSGSEEPVVFGKRYNSSARDIKERFYWDYFGVGQSLVDKRYFDEESRINTPEAEKYISSLDEIIMNKISAGNDKTKREIFIQSSVDFVSDYFSLSEEGIEFEGDNDGFQRFKINEKAFEKYGKHWLFLFEWFITHGMILITNKISYGSKIILTPEGEEIKEVSKKISDVCKKISVPELKKMIQEELPDVQDEKKEDFEWFSEVIRKIDLQLTET